MRKLTLTAVVAAATLVSAPAADAHPDYHYAGGCSVAVVSVGTVNSPDWRFITTIAAMATEPGAGTPVPVPIRVDCWLRINGVSHGYLASGSFEAVVVTPPQSTVINAPFDAVVTVCDDVTVAGEFHRDCFDVPLTHPDGQACRVTNGDVYAGDKLLYDCPPYIG